MSTIFDSNYRNDPVEQQPLHLAKPLAHIQNIKDLLTLELRRFFTTEKNDVTVVSEAPSIDKYKVVDSGQNEDPFLSAVNIIRTLADTGQRFPIITVVVATGKTWAMSLNSQYIGVVQDPPRIQTNRGPWIFPKDSELLFKTKLGLTRITFTAPYAADFNRVLPKEVAAAINSQSNRIVAEVQPDESIVIRLKTPELEFIEVLPVDTYDYTNTEGPAADPSGLITGDPFFLSGISRAGENFDASPVFAIVGLIDDVYNPIRPPKHRYHTAKDLTLSIGIGAEDDNQRTELTDLLGYFFDLRLNEKFFALLGDPKKGQNWQIMFRNQMTLGGESEIPRSEGDGVSKIYINRVSIPLVSVDYVDRPAVRPSSVTYAELPLNTDQ